MKTPLIFLVLLLSACTHEGYLYHNQETLKYLHSGNYEASLNSLEKNKYLKTDYNRDLYHVEKGRLLFLSGKYEEAARELIPVELTMEDYKSFFYRSINGVKTYQIDNRYSKDGRPIPSSQPNSVSEMVDYNKRVGGMSSSYQTGSFKSPEKLNFAFYDFEKPLVNFYVGLCGIYLNDEKTSVESRRLDLMAESFALRKFPLNSQVNAYSENPFVYLMSGIFYEQNGDINNALISYEKALEAYNQPYCYANYGLRLPWQLVKDVYRLNRQLGFKDRMALITQKYGYLPDSTDLAPNTMLILVEQGHVPVKKLDVVWYKNGAGPYPDKQFYGYVVKTSRIQMVPQMAPSVRTESIAIDGKTNTGELICNLDYEMDVIIKNRLAAEHKPLPPPPNPPTKNTTVYNTTNYDSRSWQTLPSGISYFRVPVSASHREVSISYSTWGGQHKAVQVKANLKSPVQVVHVFLQ